MCQYNMQKAKACTLITSQAQTMGAELAVEQKYLDYKAKAMEDALVNGHVVLGVIERFPLMLCESTLS